MTKISWLKFPLTLLAVGKIPISNFCISCSTCKCHSLVKPGEAGSTPSRSYISKIMAVSENDQNFVVEVPTVFTRLKKNTYLQFLHIFSTMYLPYPGKTGRSWEYSIP